MSDTSRRLSYHQRELLDLKAAFTQSAVTDGTALDRSQSRNWLDFGSGRERFRPSRRVQPAVD